MERILLIGSSQIQHIQILLEDANVKVTMSNALAKNRILRLLNRVRQLLDVDCIYIVYGVEANNLLVRIATLLNKKVIIHWIGTDVKNMLDNKNRKTSYPRNTIHLAGSKLLQNELQQCGIDSCIIPIIPWQIDLKMAKMPTSHAALVYLPEGREEFYGANMIQQLARDHNNVSFHIVANTGYEPLKMPNVVFHGRLSLPEMTELYDNITILIRLPEHDGLSMMVIEALSKGKNVLYKYEHPFAVTPKTMNYEDVNIAFSNILNLPITANIEAHNYINEFYNHEKMIELYRKAGVV